MSTAPAPVQPPCPRCERSDRVGEIEYHLHRGGGEWTTYRLRICQRCDAVFPTVNFAASA